MTSTTKTMVLLIAIMMLADKINAGCNQRQVSGEVSGSSASVLGSGCRRDSGREERLWNAAYAGNLAEVKQLLQFTFVDPTPKYGRCRIGTTPLIAAAFKGHKDVVQLLLDNNADIDHRDSNVKTALMFAAWKGHKDVIQVLLDNGANVNHQDKKGYTALMKAAQYGHKEVVQLLLDNGANIDKQDSEGFTALILAAINRKKDV